MQGEFKDRLARHRKTLTYIHLPANHTIWFNQAPKLFTTLAASFKQGVDAFGTAHEAQSAPVSWAQQNKEEKELEDLAHPLSNALYLHLTATGHADTAAEWEMELTDWRKLDEQLLLDKGLRLHTQLLAALAAPPTRRTLRVHRPDANYPLAEPSLPMFLLSGLYRSSIGTQGCAPSSLSLGYYIAGPSSLKRLDHN